MLSAPEAAMFVLFPTILAPFPSILCMMNGESDGDGTEQLEVSSEQREPGV